LENNEEVCMSEVFYISLICSFGRARYGYIFPTTKLEISS